MQNAFNAGDLHTFVEALVRHQHEEAANVDLSDLNAQLASLADSTLLRLISAEDKKLLRQHWDKHVQNARIADLPVLKDIVPNSSVFDSVEPDLWCPVSSAAKLIEKIAQLEQKEQILHSAVAELGLASDLQSLREAFVLADRIVVSEKLSADDLEQRQEDICQAVRHAICQADRASDLHEFRKDKNVWSLGDGKWWSADLEKTWKSKVQECELLERKRLEAAMSARRLAAEGQDYQALEDAIAEAEKLGAQPDAIANARLYQLKSKSQDQSRWHFGWR